MASGPVAAEMLSQKRTCIHSPEPGFNTGTYNHSTYTFSAIEVGSNRGLDGVISRAELSDLANRKASPGTGGKIHRFSGPWR
jgi:hypothetical protein